MSKRPSADPLAGTLNLRGFALFREHWPLYGMEAAELAIFMISACAFTVLLFHPHSPIAETMTNPWARRACMGVAMGVTAVLIIHSPMGKRSGAHFNPSITLTYLLMGKIRMGDAAFYVAFQFLGGIGGVAISALIFGRSLADPAVNYAVTVPGLGGTPGAFAAELFMAALLMGVVLITSNRPKLAPMTSYFVGILISQYILFLAPVSGFSINPARTVGSAVFAQVWTAVWIYFAAPILGMFGVADVYRRWGGIDRILCAKLHPSPGYACPFLCRLREHGHDASIARRR